MSSLPRNSCEIYGKEALCKVARTIADREACVDVLERHNRGAHHPYRNLDWPSYLGINV